jgi:hypothetical protein
VLLFCVSQNAGFSFFVLHQPNNYSENISILFLPVFHSLAKQKEEKKRFFGRKNIGALHTPRTPMDPETVLESPGNKYHKGNYYSAGW